MNLVEEGGYDVNPTGYKKKEVTWFLMKFNCHNFNSRKWVTLVIWNDQQA